MGGWEDVTNFFKDSIDFSSTESERGVWILWQLLASFCDLLSHPAVYHGWFKFQAQVVLCESSFLSFPFLFLFLLLSLARLKFVGIIYFCGENSLPQRKFIAEPDYLVRIDQKIYKFFKIYSRPKQLD